MLHLVRIKRAVARNLAAYAKHRDRSVAIAGKGWAKIKNEKERSDLFLNDILVK